MLHVPKDVQARVLLRADRDEAGCLVSNYSVGTHGYAQVGWAAEGRRTSTLAHRVAWTAVHGPIADGMTVDHLCRNRKCIEVEHLRLLSNFENARRTAGRDWPLGECVNGHSNAELAFSINGNKAFCKPCKRASQRRWSEANPERAKEAQRAYRARKRKQRQDTAA